MKPAPARATPAPKTDTNEMPRGSLIGVRFSPEEKARLEALARHFESTHPGVSFNLQMAIHAAIAIVARDAGIELAPVASAPASRPRIARKAARKR